MSVIVDVKNVIVQARYWASKGSACSFFAIRCLRSLPSHAIAGQSVCTTS